MPEAEKVSAVILSDLQPVYKTITKKQRGIVFGGVVLCLFLASLDQNIVVVALPQIITELGHPELLSWIVASFMLTSSAMTPLYGRFSDVFGRRIVYLACLATFVVGSAIGGAAPTIWTVIIGRGVQGLGGGGLIGLAVIVIGDIVEPPERPKYLSSIAAMFGISSVLGPLIGGLFVDKATWRWVFYINIPLGIIAFVTLFFAMNYESKKRDLPLDIAGAIIIALAAICVVLFISWGGNADGYPWDSGVIIGLIGASIILGLLFVWQESRHVLPMLNLSLLKGRLFALVCFSMFFSFFVFLGAMVFLTVYFQESRGDSAIIAGLKAIPFIIGLIIASAVGGARVSKTGNPDGLLPVGTASAAIGNGLFMITDAHTNYGYHACFMILVGFGMGMVLPVSTTIIQNVLPHTEMANGLSSLRFFQNLGGAIGVSVMGAIFSGSIATRIKETFDRKESIAYATARVFAVGSGLCLLAFAACLAMPSVKLFEPKQKKGSDASDAPRTAEMVELGG